MHSNKNFSSLTPTPPNDCHVRVDGALYTDHDVIYISGNQHFHTQAAAEGWPGNGTPSNPYIIRDLRIEKSGVSWTEDYLIDIRNVDVFFSITECLLIGLLNDPDTKEGIHFQNTTNGCIINNTLLIDHRSYYDSIRLESSQHNVITDNLIFRQDTTFHTLGIAINLQDSNNNIIARNSIFNHSYGIYVTSSHHNSICENTVYDNRQYGIITEDSNEIMIENNYVYRNYWTGIYLSESTNCSLLNNTVFKNGHSDDDGVHGRGIGMDSYHTSLINNTVKNNYGDGITMGWGGSNNLILNTHVVNNSGYGIRLRKLLNSTIKNVNVLNNHQSGIIIQGSHSCLISESLFSKNEGNGIWIEDESQECTISNNTISENQKNGIYIYTCDRIFCFNNKVRNNDKYGISLEDSQNIAVYFNNFIDNNPDGGSQAEEYQFFYHYHFSTNGGYGYYYVEDVSKLSNVFTHNFWYDWRTPDNNNDSIVDFPYPIDGNIDSFDWDPLISPYNSSSFHIMSVPQILSPKGGGLYSGTIHITWLPVVDSFSHEITYTLFYSDDAGKTWILMTIVQNVNSYTWQTTSLPDGKDYLIKVVANCSEGLISEFIILDEFSINNSLINSTFQSADKSNQSIQVTIEFSLVIFIVALTYSSYLNRKRN